MREATDRNKAYDRADTISLPDVERCIERRICVPIDRRRISRKSRHSIYARDNKKYRIVGRRRISDRRIDVRIQSRDREDSGEEEEDDCEGEEENKKGWEG